MIIGRLDKKIKIYKKERTPDGQGGYTTTSVLVYDVWASISIPRTTTEVISGGVSSEMQFNFTIRKKVGTMAGWQIKYLAREFEILHNYDDNFGGTILQAREIVKRG